MEVSSELADSSVLLQLLGSHWNTTYRGEATVGKLLHATGRLAQQTENDMYETLDSLSFDTIPVWHRERMRPLILKESELNTEIRGVLLWDDAEQVADFDDARRFTFDGLVNREVYSFPIRSDIHSIACITELTNDCRMSLTWQLDFFLDATRQAITFYDNPFNNPLLTPRITFDAAGNTIRTLELWMWAVDFDRKHIYTQFGHLIAEEFASSDMYRRFVSAAMLALRSGGGRTHIERIAEAATGVLLAQSAETVELLLTFGTRKIAVTNKQVYQYLTSANWMVAVGDVLSPGQPIVDALRLTPAKSIYIPDGYLGFCLGQGLLNPVVIKQGLFFYNKEVPLRLVSRHGKRFAEFELGGTGADLAAFWEHAHGAQTPYTSTLAYLLDARLPKSTNAADAALPATINPCRFLFDNLLSVGVSWLHVNIADCDGGIGLHALNLIRDILPPWLMLAVQLNLLAGTKIIDVDGIVGTPDIEGLFDSGYIGPNVPLTHLIISPASVTFQEAGIVNTQACGN